MIYHRDRMYDLLPVEYRVQDAEKGYPLRALLRIVSSQATLVEEDIQTFWNDLFIETSRRWVVPYIGDLVGNRALADATRLSDDSTARRLFPDLAGPDLRAPVAVRSRADVAKTIYFRRRKGTLPMLEELARDVTGWPAHAVEFFELLGWHQHLEHVRFQSRWTDVRSVDLTDRIEGPFDETSHTVDVRAIAQQEGWHGIPKVGFFLYRLNSFELDHVPARRASASWRYHFSPLGNPAPMFSRWRREGDEAGLATELHVGAPIRGPFFHEDLKRYAESAQPRPDMTDLYGLPEPLPSDPTDVCPECSFVVIRNGTVITPTLNPNAPPSVYQPQIVCRQLDPWPATQPSGQIVGIDVENGRLTLGDGFPGVTRSVDVYYHYGFPAELGGGPYERHKWLVNPDVVEHELFVREGVSPGTPNTFASVTDAITHWRTTLGRADAVITILDNRTYTLPASIRLPDDGGLVIQAANRSRPLLQTRASGLRLDTLPPAVPGDPDRQAAFTLSGVVVEGHLRVDGDMGRLRLLHTTLIPGRQLTEEGDPDSTGPSLTVRPGTAADPVNAQLRVEIAFSVLGRMVVPSHADGIWLLDSILDALSDTRMALRGSGTSQDAAPLHVERSTVMGRLRIRTLEMSESIATGLVRSARTQTGCVRFSYVPPSSVTPRRYRCQPDLAVRAAIDAASARNPAITDAEKDAVRTLVRSQIVPGFTTTRYGQPAYAQLRHSAPLGIRTGAEDGSEMGAYSHVKQAQREANLRLRLDEYLPFGLEAGVLYAT